MFKPDSRVLRRTALTLGILALAVLSDPPAKTSQRAGLVLSDTRNSMAIYDADARRSTAMRETSGCLISFNGPSVQAALT
jgi:hypothetical protein